MSNLWQQPYVNVFKHFNVSQWKKASKEGDVTPVMDKTVKATVFKISGHIPAGNYIQIPRLGAPGLGLSGRYFYLLFRPIATKYFVVHIDVATRDCLVVRLSFSNLFKEFKSTSTWLQFPFLCNPAKGSVAFYAAVGAKENSGPALGSTRWTVLCLDLSYILSVYLNRSFAYVKGFRLCANMMVKNVFTSDVLYDPGISMEEAKTTKGGRHMSPLPREFGFLTTKGWKWDDLYDLIRFPPDGHIKPFDSVQHAVDDSNRFSPEEGVEEKPCRIEPETKSISKCVSERVSMIHKLTEPKKPVKKHVVVTEVPDLPDGKLLEFNQSNIHVYAHPGRHDADADAKLSDRQSFNIDKAKLKKRRSTPVFLTSQQSKECKTLEPDPILKLKRIVGFGGACYRDVLWTADLSSVVYPCHAVIVVMRLSNGHQRFLIGHTDKVSCMSFNGDHSLLASGQTGQMSVVRLWKIGSGECLAMVRTHTHSVYSLNFAESGKILCGVGKDAQGKNLVVIWSTGDALRREISVLSRAHTDVDISRMIIAGLDDSRMVSCGKDNIRLWRLKDGTLRSAPVNLGEFHAMDFTDVCLWSAGPNAKNPREKIIFACSRSGHMFEIDYEKSALKHVRHLLPTAVKAKKLTDTLIAKSGLAITSISMNETFCVTGSEDGYLRLWPLDFAHVYLEAEHEGAVTAVSLSSDGLSILAATSAGNLGVLDVSSRGYTTVMRSHTDHISSIALDPDCKLLASVSKDNSIRVWDAETLQQLFDFSTPGVCPTTICYHPAAQIFACGFQNGTLRVFNVQSTCLLAEHHTHRGEVTGVVYSPDAQYLFSACSEGTLVTYSSQDDKYRAMRIIPNTLAKGKRFAPDSLAVSPDGKRLAFVGPSDYTITILDTAYLTELARVDIGSVTANDSKNSMDTALHLAFTPATVGHLLVTTTNNRLVKLETSGRLVAEVNDIHRNPNSSLVVSGDGKYLITAGDRVLKVWDYNMKLDINFQVFIGHSEAISKVLYTEDMKNVISTGGAIYIWDNLAYRPETPPIQGRMLSDKDADDYFQPGNVAYSQMENPRSAPPRPMQQPDSPGSRLGDLSSIHGEVWNGSSPGGTAGQGQVTRHQYGGDTSLSSSQRRIQPVTDLAKKQLDKKLDELTITKGRGASATKKLARKRRSSGAGDEKPWPPPKPTCFKHFSERSKEHPLAQRRYTAPPNQAGLKLASIIGYNGNGRDNMVWCADSGLFVYTSGCVVVIEDLSSGAQTHLHGHPEEISTLAIQNNYEMLASASGSSSPGVGCQVCVWQVSSGTCQRVLNHHLHQVVSMAYSSNDRYLVTVGDYRDCEVALWCTLKFVLLTSTRAREPVHSVRWDPISNNEFITVGEKGTLSFWMMDEGQPDDELNVHDADIPKELLKMTTKEEVSFTAVQFAPDSIVYASTNNGRVSAWDTRHNSCFMYFDADVSEIGCICVGGSKLVTGSRAGQLRLWATDNVSVMKSGKRGNDSPGLTMDDEMSLEGGVVSACFDDKLEMGIVGTSGSSLWYINWLERTSIRLISGHAQPVTNIAISNGGLMATSSADGSIRVWVLRSREQALQFQVKDQTCNCVAFAPSPKPTKTKSKQEEVEPEDEVVPPLAAGFGDGTLRVFDVNAVEMALKLHPHSKAITAIVYSADGHMVLSGSQNGLIAVTSPHTGMTVRVLGDHKGAPITSLDVTRLEDSEINAEESTPHMWLACSGDRRVSVWSADWGQDSCELVDWLSFPAPAFDTKGNEIKPSDQYSVLPRSLAKFSTEEMDMVVYTGYGMNMCLQLYSLTNRKVVRTISLSHWAACLDLSSDSPLIAVGVKEHLLRLLDYYEGSFQDYASYDDAVSVVCFTPDGSQLVTGVHGQLVVWNVTL